MSINGDKVLRVRSTRLEDEDDDAEAVYVQSVKINGQDWDRNWFEHDDVMVQGGTIEFVLGREMKAWDEGGVPPPSPGHFRV